MVDETEANNWLPPGSPEAVERGCLCPVLDNAHGAGVAGDGGKKGWWYFGDCPVHFPPDQPCQESDHA